MWLRHTSPTFAGTARCDRFRGSANPARSGIQACERDKRQAGRSLTLQIIGIVVVAQLLCAGLLCGAALWHERNTRLRALDIRLQGRSDSPLGAIQDAEDSDNNVTIDLAELALPNKNIYAV